MTIPFETSGRWSVKHGQDFFADVINTRGMDFSRPGFATLGRKPIVLYNRDVDDGFRTLQAIVPLSSGTSTNYYFVTTNAVFKWDATTSAFTKLSTSNITLGNGSDGVIFNGDLVVSSTTKVSKYVPGSDSWTDEVTSLSSSYPIPLCVSEHQQYLAVGNQNTVALYSTSYGSAVTTLTIPTEYIVTGIRWRASNLYIATRNIGGNSAKLFVWNGSGTAAQSAWSVRANWIYSLAEFQSSIVVLSSRGQLLRFNGGGFDELAHFPVYDTPYSWNTSSALSNSTGRCANRGMVAHGDVLYMNIDGSLNSAQADSPGKFLDTQPSGLWVYDANVGLYHRAGYAYTQYNAASYTFGSSNFVFSSAHNLHTGDPVYPTNVTGLTGVNANQLYFAIVDSSTSIRLAYSRADALAGRALSITGTPSAPAMIIDTFDMVGAVFTQTFPGAVGTFVSDNPPSILGTEIMYGATVTKSDGTTKPSLMSLGNNHGVGSFTTTPLPAKGIIDTFQKLYQMLDNFYLPDAEIVIKYRSVPRYGFPTQYRKDNSGGLATWVNSTNFTIDTTGKDFKGSKVGDEVEIIEGAGAGYTAHISAIDDSTSTYTVTIDEAIPGISTGNKSEIIVDNWNKLSPTVQYTDPTISDQYSEKSMNAENSGNYYQFKIELRGIKIGVRKMEVLNVTNKSIG